MLGAESRSCPSLLAELTDEVDCCVLSRIEWAVGTVSSAELRDD